MYVVRLTCWIMVLALASTVACGQAKNPAVSTEALKELPLTVWVVRKGPKRYVPPHPRTAVETGFTASKIVDPDSPETHPSQKLEEVRDPQADRLESVFKDSFPGTRVEFKQLYDDELMDKLASAEGTAEYPDVVMGWSLPASWLTHPAEGRVTILGSRWAITEDSNPAYMDPIDTADISISLRAPHPEAARAFVVWLSERRRSLRPNQLTTIMKGDATVPAATAVRVVEDMLTSGAVEDRDPEEAEFSGAIARMRALGPAPPNLGFHADVLFAEANEHLALVTLRVIASSETAFGVVHPLVVLRRSPKGEWKVLQVTPNLEFEMQGRAVRWLDHYAAPSKKQELKQVKGISQAAPLDGDSRQPKPELWWDNSGDGTLLIVEWQNSYGPRLSDSRMFFVNDSAFHLQTRITAEFANVPGTYQWRVWTVANSGVLTISPWRKLIINP
jgi:hypothetical protein